MNPHVRKTSSEAYKTIKENGLLSKRRFEVYSHIYKNGPCTIRSTYEALAMPGVYINSFSPCFTELSRFGVLDKIGTCFDKDTKQTVILFDVNDRIPRKVENSKVHILIVQINNLEAKLKFKKIELNKLTASKYKPDDENLRFEI